jgi:outer membrane biosynthesis protein TonB
MRLGIILSALFHLTVLLAGLVVLPAKWDSQEKFERIPVELLTLAEFTNVIAKSEDAAEEPELALPEPIERKVEATPPPPTPEPEQKVVSEDAMPPLPDIKPKEKKPEPKIEAKPKVVKPSNSLAKAQPRKKPTPPTPAKDDDDFNFDNIAALLDKTPTEDKKPPVAEKDDALDDFLASLADDNQEAVGLGNDLTISEKDSFGAHMARCWRTPAGAANPEELVVDLRVFLNRDGSLASPPEVISSGASSFGNNTFIRAAEDAARRAVVKCAPYDFLPDDKYDRWDDFTMTFDPAKMIGR